MSGALRSTEKRRMFTEFFYKIGVDVLFLLTSCMATGTKTQRFSCS